MTIMQYINPDVSTICTGMASQWSGFVNCGKSEKGCFKTFQSNDSSTLEGQKPSDIEITKGNSKIKKELYEIIATFRNRL